MNAVVILPPQKCDAKLRAMTNWIDIRKQCGFTQPEMAQYLGVSRSSYGMFEQGRSPLNASAIRRLATLLSTLTGMGKEVAVHNNEVTRQCREQLSRRVADCRALAARYQQQIIEMQERYSGLEQMNLLLKRLSASVAEDAFSSAWISLQQSSLPGKMEACNADARLVLQCRTEALLAEADILERYLNDKG